MVSELSFAVNTYYVDSYKYKKQLLKKYSDSYFKIPTKFLIYLRYKKQSAWFSAKIRKETRYCSNAKIKSTNSTKDKMTKLSFDGFYWAASYKECDSFLSHLWWMISKRVGITQHQLQIFQLHKHIQEGLNNQNTITKQIYK